MVNKNKILSDLSKFAVDAMGAFSGLKEEIETIVSLRVDKVIKKAKRQATKSKKTTKKARIKKKTKKS